MDEFLLGISRSLIPATVVAVLTAIITVRLSMRQFYSQRWWEKKAEAYSEIVQNLSFLQFYFGERFDEGVGLKTLSDEDKNKLLNDYKKSKESLIKSSFIGAYIVSERTNTLLQRLVKDLRPKGSDFVADLDRLYGVVLEGLKNLKLQAKEDLRLK